MKPQKTFASRCVVRYVKVNPNFKHVNARFSVILNAY